MKYDVEIAARKEGAIGSHGTERRRYTVEANTLAEARPAAISAAYKEGGLEHVTVLRVRARTDNPNCGGNRCTVEDGEVRVYPLGGGGNLILCHACWAHENQYRYIRGVETHEPKNWPQINWHTAEIYENK